MVPSLHLVPAAFPLDFSLTERITAEVTNEHSSQFVRTTARLYVLIAYFRFFCFDTCIVYSNRLVPVLLYSMAVRRVPCSVRGMNGMRQHSLSGIIFAKSNKNILSILARSRYVRGASVCFPSRFFK